MDAIRGRGAKRGRGARRTALAQVAGTALLLTGTTTFADVSLPPITIGAGLQTNAYSCNTGCVYSPGTVPTDGHNVQGVALDSVRLYINGNVTDTIKMTFDTEYNGSTDGVNVLDAIGRFELSDHVNVWAGRFLPPSDRANLYGPYYANDWAPYADNVADFYPSVEDGRDNGVAYWGQFGMLKVQAGFFDGGSLNSAVADKTKLLLAGRLTLDLWDAEPGYYFNGTFYGDKDILAFGLAAQNQDAKTAWSLDALMEKKLPNLGAVSVEAEFQKDDGLTLARRNHGWYGLASYLFPQVIGIGKVQVLGKYSQKTEDSAPTALLEDRIKTGEFNLNYIIKEFNARVGLYYLNQKDVVADTSKKEIGLKLQLQM